VQPYTNLFLSVCVLLTILTAQTALNFMILTQGQVSQQVHHWDQEEYPWRCYSSWTHIWILEIVHHWDQGEYPWRCYSLWTHSWTLKMLLSECEQTPPPLSPHTHSFYRFGSPFPPWCDTLLKGLYVDTENMHTTQLNFDTFYLNGI